jgi:hypothetical protein
MQTPAQKDYILHGEKNIKHSLSNKPSCSKKLYGAFRSGITVKHFNTCTLVCSLNAERRDFRISKICIDDV